MKISALCRMLWYNLQLNGHKNVLFMSQGTNNALSVNWNEQMHFWDAKYLLIISDLKKGYLGGEQRYPLLEGIQFNSCITLYLLQTCLELAKMSIYAGWHPRFYYYVLLVHSEKCEPRRKIHPLKFHNWGHMLWFL